ncbi:MAG TPA: DNRLRE domain-containing protein, partial [Propionibacteriaceae bacterium]
MTVEVRPAGFEQLWVVKSPVGLAALAANRTLFGGAFSSTMTVEGMSASPTVDGGIEFVADAGKRAGFMAAPTMWDANVDPDTREPRSRTRGKFGVKLDGETLQPGQKGSGKLQFQVLPNAAWLSSPLRQFPITIDPTYAAATGSLIYDAFVEETWTSDWSADPKLKFGDNGAGNIARTYMAFSTTPFLGKRIMSASLDFYGTYVRTCSPRGWSSWNAGVATTATRWTNQPWISDKYATSTQAKGYQAACPNGTMSIDMKVQLQMWANRTETTRGLVLRGDSETDTQYWKEVASSETSTPPVLRYTYNRLPSIPTTPTLSPSVMFTPAWATAPRIYTGSTTPSVSTIVSDPDGNTLRGEFYVFNNSTGTSGHVSSCLSAYVASGSAATCVLSPALPVDGLFYLRSRGNDGTQIGSLSAARELRVAGETPPAPLVSCPSPYSAASWNTTPPAANLTCRITATAPSGYSTPSKIHWSVDGATFTDTTIRQSTDPNVSYINVTVSRDQGAHSIRAAAISPVGRSSAQTTHHMGYGAASLIKPTINPKVTTVDQVEIEASGPPKGSSALPTAQLEWRVSGAIGGLGWTSAPTTNQLTVGEADGAIKATGLFETSTVVGQADSSSVTVNGRVPTLVDIRVCLSYTAGTQCTNHSTVLRVPHAFNSGFPVADA